MTMNSDDFMGCGVLAAIAIAGIVGFSIGAYRGENDTKAAMQKDAARHRLAVYEFNQVTGKTSWRWKTIDEICSQAPEAIELPIPE